MHKSCKTIELTFVFPSQQSRLFSLTSSSEKRFEKWVHICAVKITQEHYLSCKNLWIRYRNDKKFIFWLIRCMAVNFKDRENGMRMISLEMYL